MIGKFTEAMIPILEQESNLVWGPQGVGKIVHWTCKQSGLSELIREALWTDGGHHKQWYLEQIAGCLGIDLEQMDRDMARGGFVERELGIAP